MKKNLIPPFLKEGDKAVIVSPSGNIDVVYVDAARDVLEEWGLHVEVAPHARNRYGRFSGTEEQRLLDLQTAMDDGENRLIFCSRGGYGAVRLLEKLDFEKLTKSPKWLVGYSDITALHQVFASNGLVSLHAPMARHLSEDKADESSLYLRETLFGNIPRYGMEGHPLNREGVAEGMLFGGNMAVFCSLLPTRYVEYAAGGGSILFLEDIAEKPYQIDRMLWSLELSGLLGKINGLIVGSFTDCEEDPLMFRTIYGLIGEMCERHAIPVAFGFPVGHTSRNYPLLHGARVRLEVTVEKTNLLKL